MAYVTTEKLLFGLLARRFKLGCRPLMSPPLLQHNATLVDGTGAGLIAVAWPFP